MRLVRNLKYEIPKSVLVLALVISLGINVYYYLVTVNKQAIINNMRGQIIVSWAREMITAGVYLQNATTNIDVYRISFILMGASEIGGAGWEKGVDLYWRMSFTASRVEENLSPYSAGSPTTVQHINPIVTKMFGNLTEKIWNVTGLIVKKYTELTSRNGVNPIQLLEEKGILEDIVEGCIDIQNYSRQIRDFSPKFQ